MSVKHGKRKKSEIELARIVDELRGNSGAATAARALTSLEKLALMAQAVQEAPLPDGKPKEGFLWQRYYDVQGGAIAWELVQDPDYEMPEGTYTHPLLYTEGMAVKAGLFYTDGAAVWECIQSGTPSGFDDRDFFDIVA